MFLFISGSSTRLQSPADIQIHLMFLFIRDNALATLSQRLFKYISCSYLSKTGQVESMTPVIQIHLMFLFISICLYIWTTVLFIQIHLMFLFIKFATSLSDSIICIQIHLMFLFINTTHYRSYVHLTDSNTSHVLIYRNRRNSQRNMNLHSNTSHVLIYRSLGKIGCGV